MILQIVQHLKPGGLEIMVLELLRLSRFRARMKIVSLEGDKASALQQWPRLIPYQEQLIFLNKPVKFSLSTQAQLRNLIAAEGAKLIHTHHIGPLFYGALSAFFSKAAHVHTEHDAWHYAETSHRRLRLFIKMLNEPVCTAVSDFVAKTLVQYGQSAPQVIKNGVDVHYFAAGDKLAARQALGLSPTAWLLGCGGRLEAVKGHEFLLRALALLDDDYHLAIAGSGALQGALQQLCAQLQLTSRVHFLGFQSDMARFYQALDLFCLPSLNEGYPLSVLEAQACNIPAAISSVGGAVETLAPESGVILHSLEAPLLAEQIAAHFSHPKATQPRQFVLQHADLQQMVNQYDLLFERLLNE
ncbi:MAG: glycosyltransferase [Vibrionaceae bacterium]